MSFPLTPSDPGHSNSEMLHPLPGIHPQVPRTPLRGLSHLNAVFSLCPISPQSRVSISRPPSMMIPDMHPPPLAPSRSQASVLSVVVPASILYGPPWFPFLILLLIAWPQTHPPLRPEPPPPGASLSSVIKSALSMSPPPQNPIPEPHCSFLFGIRCLDDRIPRQ